MKRLWPYAVAVVLFVGYCIWIAGPYLRSIIVRDAAITTWSNTVTAPIEGTVTLAPVTFGGRTGDDGLIATVTNLHISREAVDAAALQVAEATARRDDAQNFLREVESLEDDRRATKAHYAEIFRGQLDVRIAALKSEIAILKRRLSVMKEIAGRKDKLAATGAGTLNAADEVLLRVTQIEVDIDSVDAELKYAQLRRAAADNGIFIEASGDDPNWVLQTRLELKLEKKKARLDLKLADIALSKATSELERAKADFQRRSSARVTAPPHMLLWSRQVVTGMSVAAGTPLAEWIDCNELLVDMPVSDVEASLISAGDPADIVLEGERVTRKAQVLLVRGSASILGRSELVATAKGRRAGVAQVILKLKAAASDFATCPVGHAAYVDFPGVGLWEVIKARLRL
jgi:hypothetical protein